MSFLTAIAVSAVLLEVPLPGASRVEYTYHDASVPPDCHRSYTITATADSVSVVVDSYGDVVADTSYATDPADYADMLEGLTAAGLHRVEDSYPEGATGFTSEEIAVFADGEPLVSGRVYNCGGEVYGNLGGDLDAAVEAVRGLVPALSRLTAPGEVASGEDG